MDLLAPVMILRVVTGSAYANLGFRIDSQIHFMVSAHDPSQLSETGRVVLI